MVIKEINIELDPEIYIWIEVLKYQNEMMSKVLSVPRPTQQQQQ